MKKIDLLNVIFGLLFFTLIAKQSSAGIFSHKVDSIEIVFDTTQLVLPSESFKIGVLAYTKNGKIRKTFGMPGGSVFWRSYCIEVIGGEIASGKINVNEKLMPSKGKYVSVKVWPRKKPTLAKTLLIPLNYETEIVFKPTSSFDKAPGCKFKGEIISTFNNGRVVHYNNLRSKKVAQNFRLSFDGLSFKKGNFLIEPDFTKIIDHRVDLWLVSQRNIEVSNTFSLLLDYKHTYKLLFSGASGRSGFSGSSGWSGASGNNGAYGEPGEDGEMGEHGPDLGVWTDAYFDSTLHCNLLYVFAENFRTQKEYKFLINPEGGRLLVRSCGGSGGSGGSGGDGGDGGRGEDGRIWYETISKTRTVKKPFTETVTKKVIKRRTTGTGEEEEYEETVTEQITVYRDVQETYEVKVKHQERGEDGGNGGDGGPGGYGAPGGDGGFVFLHFTADAWGNQKNIVAQSDGGSGGFSGSGGNGGCGGSGGNGEPSGRNGCSGFNGTSGWCGGSGRDGQISVQQTEEFFFYKTVATLSK